MADNNRCWATGGGGETQEFLFIRGLESVPRSLFSIKQTIANVG